MDRFTLVHRPKRVNQGTCPYDPNSLSYAILNINDSNCQVKSLCM